ncbi:50S ribosomal protein L29 [Buchnera aphidicola (Sipha maydis)]|uniref:50S ribosomal protein L29 n=1 Tax=Buchnera aphidicola TaxID=9 RepID=UPI0025432F16|nr:50S ribosomal protein L29 [Buchnera aphidicola]WII23622.1 50S ribosomal protein L29 [Buchnera aphidicola (Sipha maydis)]
MKVNELRKKKYEDLNLELISLLREKFNLKMQLSNKKLQNTHLLKENRKKIAILKTILSEQEKKICQKKVNFYKDM